MAIIMKRQLNDDEKQRVLEIYGRNCYATGHAVPDGEPINFDHIRAYSTGGGSYVDNIAPMCERHNKEKGRLPLEDFRIKLKLNDFFASGDRLTLGSLLEYLKGKDQIQRYGEPVSIITDDGGVQLESAGWKTSTTLHACSTTNLRYFYMELPLEVIDSDDEDNTTIGLQPRHLISDKVFNMYRHFQRHPVLQPSIGRIANNRIKIFDGQHKIASLLWVPRDAFECKIYLPPEGIYLSPEDLRLLNDTNIAAHDKFAQTRFYSSVMVVKLGSMFGSDFEKYKNIEDDDTKSEAGFMRYLATHVEVPMSTFDRNNRFRSYLYNSVLEDDANQMRKYVSETNRRTDKKPITIDMLEKSIFSDFLYREPVEDNLATDAYKREFEIANTVELMNMLCELALSDWNPEASSEDERQLRLTRIFRSKSMMAWSELLRDAVCGKLDLVDSDDQARPFYRELTADELASVKNLVHRLVNWSMWSVAKDSEVDRVLADNKSEVKKWLKSKGLTTGYLMGAPE